jgi:predicted Ser/Thr protein kinase
MAPRRYSAACNEQGTLLLVRSPTAFAGLSPRLSIVSKLTGVSAAGSGWSASGGSSPDTARSPDQRAALFFKLRSSTLAVHLDSSTDALFRAPVLALLAADDVLLRVTIKIGPRRGRADTATATDAGSTVERLMKGNVVTLEAEDDEDYTRWRNAFGTAAGTSFPMHYKRGRCIGRGHFSNVYLATDKLTGERFAVKVIKGDHKRPDKTRKYVRREVKVLSITDHENLVSAYDFFSYAGKPHLVLEYVPNGSLMELVSRKGRLSENEAKPIMAGILRGVAYLHSLGIVHRDIKPDNVLMASMIQPKISDFGLSIFVNGDETVTSVVGTPLYVSPEACSGVPYGRPSDVWSCGVLLYYMLSGERPFRGDTRSELKRAIVQGSYEFPDKTFRFVGRKAKHLIACLLTKNRTLRFTAEQAVEHDWFTGSP